MSYAGTAIPPHATQLLVYVLAPGTAVFIVP
jgi:hypothetical protein